MPEADGTEGVLADMLAASHRLRPHGIPALVQEAGVRLGLASAEVYVVDLQQRHLVALPSSPPQQHGGGEVGGEAEQLPVDNSLAGHAYRTQTVRVAQSGDAGAQSTGWVPVVDGIGRLGVLRVRAPELDASLLERCRALADLVAMVLTTKQLYSDELAQTMRSRPMSLQAELLWAFLPPRTIGTDAVTSSAVLEPAYEAGGDAYDHSLTGTTLHLTLLDAMGHDLASGGCSAVALAACRSTRRAGGGLDDIAREIDSTLERWIPDRLLTCVIANLDTVTGRLQWVNCGHPPPLLIRDRHIVTGALDGVPHLPLGLTGWEVSPPPVQTVDLEPGDRVLLITDGVTEARSASGELFGEERLADIVVRSMVDGFAAPEALRRLIEEIVVHQDQRLHDDATIVLVEWHPRH